MTAALLLAAVLAGPQQPAVSAAVDRTEVQVGEVVTLTIRVTVSGSEPARIGEPILAGLEVRGSRDVTRVRVEDGVPRREVTRELRLLAIAPGVATIGSVRVRWSDQSAETAPITITVRAAGATTVAASLAPRLRTVLDTLRPPPPGDDVVVEVLPLPEAVTLGEQLDLITLAWFPRELRLQLRTPPTLAGPAVEGVWGYDQTTQAGVVTSRQAGGRWYDLYVSYQVVFPLSAGVVTVGRATVAYVRPLSYSFLSRELQHEVQSESLFVPVDPQPAEGRPGDFSGAAGRALAVALQTSDTTLTAGSAATVSVTVSGIGNVALWPEPRLAWPPGIRVYPAGTDVEVEGQEGLVGGTKRFRYLVIADSAGAHLVAGLSYPYFDTATRDYVVAAAPGVRLIAPPGVATGLPRPLPAPLLPRDGPGLAERIAGMARWLWLVLLALPPLAAVGVQALARLPRPRPHASASERDAQALEALARELRQALERRAGNAVLQEGTPLAAALRAAGVEASLAQHVARVRDRLRQAVFGPHDSADREELSAEVREVLRALAGETPGAERRQLVETTLGLFLLLAAAVPATAQAPRPEQLYDAGAFRTAADSFSARVAREPAVAAYWYNLGAAFYRLGEDGRARAAWIRAARLAPRREGVRRAMALLPGDPLAHDIAPVAPVTPAEAATLGLLLWVVGWGLVIPGRTRRVGVVVVGLALVAATAAWRVDRRYREPAAVALVADVPLRSAPFASAPSSRQLPLGGVVRVRAVSGAWLLVSRGDAAGWVQVGEVARL